MKKSIKLFSSLIVLVMLFGTLAGCSMTKDAKPQAIADGKQISTNDLKSNINKPDWIVVDTRINDAFNGWKLDGVKRGGHIKGATDFAANWLNVEAEDKDKKLAEILKVKGITPEKKIVLYDANGKDAKEVVTYLTKNGFANLYTYDVKQWADNSSLAMESYPNYQMLVPASWVADLIAGKKPETYSGNSFKLFEVSWGEEKNSYVKGHLPGAVHIDTDEEESPPLWSLNSDEELIKFAENNGITLDTTVVLEGEDPMAAYRVAAILKYLGVKDVRILNGGFNSWIREGYTVETTSNAKVAVADFGTKVPLNKGYIIGIDQAKEILADKSNSILVDTRSRDEYIGKITGYKDLKFKGRPAGSVWGHAGSDPNHLEDYRNIDNTMRNGSEILAMWKEQGITPDKRLSFMCGSGWRAAEVMLYADTMGVKSISMYANGWYEWSANPNNPVEIGEPKN
ncbi:MAG TPA: rhodanese-like domain-containing protein [Desulfosporosinus sp.]|nr:rhodanese-like domain-containing protein [Desulfosporosinus sp.]